MTDKWMDGESKNTHWIKVLLFIEKTIIILISDELLYPLWYKILCTKLGKCRKYHFYKELISGWISKSI